MHTSNILPPRYEAASTHHPYHYFSAVDLICHFRFGAGQFQIALVQKQRTVAWMPRRDKPGHHSIAADYLSLADPDLFAANVRLSLAEIHAPQGQRVGRLQATFPVRLDRGGAIRARRPHRLQNSAIARCHFHSASSGAIF
jgi:hypothetical protein